MSGQEAVSLIEVKTDDHGMTIDGHAGYGEYGKDIICAAVSALVQSFICSVETLTEDEIQYNITDGHIDIKYGDFSERGRLFRRSFYMAVEWVEEAYGSRYVHLYHADGR